MHQLTFVGPRQLEWREVSEPVLDGPLGALIRPLAVATCDLDRAIIAGRHPSLVHSRWATRGSPRWWLSATGCGRWGRVTAWRFPPGVVRDLRQVSRRADRELYHRAT